MENQTEENVNNKIEKEIHYYDVKYLIVKNNRNKYFLFEPAYEHKIRSIKINKDDTEEEIISKLDKSSKEYDVCKNDNNLNPQVGVEIVEDNDTLKHPEHNKRFWNVVENIKKKIKEYNPDLKKAVTVGTLALGLIGSSSMFSLSQQDFNKATLDFYNSGNSYASRYVYSYTAPETNQKSIINTPTLVTSVDTDLNTVIKLFNKKLTNDSRFYTSTGTLETDFKEAYKRYNKSRTKISFIDNSEYQENVINYLDPVYDSDDVYIMENIFHEHDGKTFINQLNFNLSIDTSNQLQEYVNKVSNDEIEPILDVYSQEDEMDLIDRSIPIRKTDKDKKIENLEPTLDNTETQVIENYQSETEIENEQTINYSNDNIIENYEDEAYLNNIKKQEKETSQSEDEIKNKESVIDTKENVIEIEEDVTESEETVIEKTKGVMEEYQSEDKDDKEINLNNAPISHENPIDKINKVQTVFTTPSNKERYDEALPPKEKDKVLDPNKNPLGEELNKQKNINENLKKEIDELKKEIENIKKPEFIKNLGSKEEVIQKLYSFLKEKNIDITINELDAYNPEDFGSKKNNYQNFFLNYSNCKLSRAELITTLFQFQPIDGVLFDWNPIEKETYGTNKNYYEQLVKTANEKKITEQLKDKLAVAYTVGSDVPKFTLLKNFITGEKQEFEGYKYNGLRLDGEGNEKVVLSKKGNDDKEILLDKKEYENIIIQNETFMKENKSEDVFYLHQFDRNKAYTVGSIVPNFGKLLDQSTGKTQVYEGYTFAEYIKDPERRDWKDQVLLVKNNKDGSKSELLISQQEYENILKATDKLNRELERIEADSYEWMIAHQEYDKRLNLDENKLRINTPENFIHNIRIGIKMKAQNPNDVFDIAKNFVDQMTENSRKGFVKMRNNYGAEKFDNMLLNEFYSHVEDIKKEELQFGSQENDEVFKQFYGEYEKGYYIGNTGKVIGDEIPISICIENLDGKKMKTPKTNFEIVKASKGRHPNTVLLYSKEYKTAYEIPLADLTEHIQKIEKEERKEEKNRKDKKYVMHLNR